MKKYRLMALIVAASIAALTMTGCSDGAAQTEQTAQSAESSQKEAPETQPEKAPETQPEEENTETSGEEASDGILTDVDLSRTEGLWRLHGADDTASIYMDGEGRFTAYYASGSIEAEGYIECFDEYGDGSLIVYHLIKDSGEFFTGFAFDSDTEFHVGNDVGQEYYLDEDYYAEASTESLAGVLINSTGFTGAVPVEMNNDYHGGYYYLDKIEEPTTVVVNTGFFAQLGEDEYPEDLIARSLNMVYESEAREIHVTESQEQTMRFTFPAYYVTWLTGYNEDTVAWTALAVLTDSYTYIYAYGTDAEYVDEMRDTWYESFEMVDLVFE